MNNKYTLLSLLFLFLLSSCSDEERSGSDSQNLAVAFTTTVGQTTNNSDAELSRASSAPTTRISGNTWSLGDEIGITMFPADRDMTNTDAFNKYTAQEGTSSSLSPVDAANTHFYPEDGSNVKFIAFYPYAELYRGSVDYDIEDQSSAEKMAACDLVYSNSDETFNKDTQTATLNFTHRLSKLTVNVKTSTDADEAIDLSKLSVTLADVITKYSYDVKMTSIVIGANTPATITPYAPADGISPTAYVAHAIVIPRNNEGRIVFTYNAEDGTKEASINIDANSITGFDGYYKAGKVYNLNFTLTAKGNSVEVEPTGCTITDWEGGIWTDNYTVDAKKEFTVAATAATDNEYTFRTNYTGTVTTIYSTSATDPHAGAPDWIENQTISKSAADSDGFITYTCKFDTKDNGSIDERIAYLHLNVEKMNVVVKMVQQCIPLTPNSYMVKPGETVELPVARANAFTAYNNEADVIDDATVVTGEVLWMDAPGLINATDLTNLEIEGTGTAAKIKVKAAAGKTGNAVVAVKAGGDIKWSWHIWVTNYAPDPATDIWMDRNLGAINATPGADGSTGLYYQWGRKDPFPSSATALSATEPTLYNIQGQFNYAIKATNVAGLDAPTMVTEKKDIAWAVNNPLVFIGIANDTWMLNSTQYDTNWNSTSNRKTLFDPCPEGYRVPLNGSWGVNDDWSDFAWDDTNKGRDTGSTYGGWYPTAGYRNPADGVIGFIGRFGYNLSSQATSNRNAYSLYNSSSTLGTKNANGSRSAGLSVRCMAE